MNMLETAVGILGLSGYAALLYSWLRALGMLALLPLSSVPTIAPLRIVLGLGLAFLATGRDAQTSEISGELAIMEFLFGMSLSLPLALALSSVAMWVESVEGLRGQTLGAILDPLSEQHEPTLSVLWRALAWVVLLCNGVGGVLVTTFLLSVEVVPLGALELVNLRVLAGFVAHTTLQSLEFLSLLLLPLAFTALLLECGLAWMGKALPHFSATHEAFVAKSAILLFLVASSWYSGMSESFMIAAKIEVPALGQTERSHGPGHALGKKEGHGGEQRLPAH